jgi:hypothetical protein
MNSLIARLLEQAPVYSLWQAPFVGDKFAPVLAHNDLAQVHRVLDVGVSFDTSEFADNVRQTIGR